MAFQDLARRRVPDPLVLAVAGPPVTPRVARDLIGQALAAGATAVVVPVQRLDPAFFDLRTGVAGDIVQALVTYRIRLVVVGGLPPAAAASPSFAAFVREANRGRHTWFVASMADLHARLAGPNGDMP